MNYTIEDVRNIRLTQTLIQVMTHYLYYIFKRYFIKYKKVYKDIILYDDGIEIKNSFIPYEYIVSFDNKSMVLLVDKNLNPSDSLLVFNLPDETDGLMKIIKNNMYYHLKYNKVNLDMLTFKSVNVLL
jgi:hypothetical protein